MQAGDVVVVERTTRETVTVLEMYRYFFEPLPPEDFLRRLVHERPDVAAPAREITDLYVRLRYLPAADAAATLAALRAATRRFRP